MRPAVPLQADPLSLYTKVSNCHNIAATDPEMPAEEGMVCTRVAYSNNVAVTDPAKLAQEFTQPHFYTPPAKKIGVQK